MFKLSRFSRLFPLSLAFFRSLLFYGGHGPLCFLFELRSSLLPVLTTSLIFTANNLYFYRRFRASAVSHSAESRTCSRETSYRNFEIEPATKIKKQKMKNKGQYLKLTNLDPNPRCIVVMHPHCATGEQPAAQRT